MAWVVEGQAGGRRSEKLVGVWWGNGIEISPGGEEASSGPQKMILDEEPAGAAGAVGRPGRQDWQGWKL